MKNKLGQALAVGLTALASAAVCITGLMVGQPMDICLVMGAPVGVAFVILLGGGWENDHD